MKKFLVGFLALFFLLPGSVFAQSVVDVSVSAGLDDVNHHLTPGHVFNTGFSFVNAGDFASTQYDWESGMRFLNIPIEQGGTISTAFLKIRASSFWGAGWQTIVLGEAADSAGAMDLHGNYDAKIRTTNSIVWNPPAWVAGTVYTSPDLVLVIQEIIDRPGWVSGNDLALFWTDGQGVGWQVQKSLRGDSFETLGGVAPQLIITWLPIPPVTAESILSGWVDFMGAGFILLFAGLGTFLVLFILKVPPLMMLIFGWLVLILLWTIGVVSPVIVLVSVVLFTGAILLRIILSPGGVET